MLKKNPAFYRIVRYLEWKFSAVFHITLSIIFSLFPIKNNKILIINYSGNGFGDNAKYLVENIINNFYDFDIVWSLKSELKEKEKLPVGVRSVKHGSLRFIFEMTTSKIWINNCRLSFFLRKRKRQFYIQFWHGGLGLKRIEGDAISSLNEKYIKYAKRDSVLADLFISNSNHLTNIYRRAFWYDGEILESGYPKNDVLFTNKSSFRSSLRKNYMLDSDVNIVLYAPTFRENHSLDIYDLDFNVIANAFKEVMGGEWVVGARLHPNIDKAAFNIVFNNQILNFTDCSDMQELILGVDALITDYSSCMFDSALAGVPTFIYASDIDNYLDERGIYFSLKDLPFSVSESSSELSNNILRFNVDHYKKNLDDFYACVGSHDTGNASQVVFDRIKKILVCDSIQRRS